MRLAPDEEANVLRVEVTDDGRGMAEDRTAGVGLHSMRERAEEVGSSCVVESPPARGTSVRTLLPLARDEGEEVEPGSRGT